MLHSGFSGSLAPHQSISRGQLIGVSDTPACNAAPGILKVRYTRRSPLDVYADANNFTPGPSNNEGCDDPVDINSNVARWKQQDNSNAIS
ncbi:3836_t:CDS:2 [Entrophospora sp. SA101]|nr:6685_t:CDS:2 [Entrophospora sp. SA101]CAJ0638362.1 14182_t:CDS:2 [Entrophospora sp. SA101]CAJ0753661.1 3836_t:CDS:2 [Entrophospora sp. SA101]CAJ0828337.1 886_t:CDS:2 [Entrophospora sp. SA101]CAJ0841879.1 8472_t:CDS:2 [Entrophospora sp. SA101]